jgi:hypothetical protein
LPKLDGQYLFRDYETMLDYVKIACDNTFREKAPLYPLWLLSEQDTSMQQRQQKQHQSKRIFTASEIAEFEYCPLVWWHEQFEPLVDAETEELFAHLVAMEHDHGPQAPSLPEYQVIEQLLLRRGAFEEGQQQHQEHADEVAEVEEERISVPSTSRYMRRLVLVSVVILVLAALVLAAAFVLSALH